MADAETIAVYNARADAYSNRFDETEPDIQLAAFIAGVPPGGRVLDLGCGMGRSAMLMKKAGLEVAAIDASEAFVDMAREKFGITVQLGTFEDLDANAVYDGIFANFSLLHAPRHEMPIHLARISRALRADGLFHVGLKIGAGEARDTIGRFYTYYTDAEITALLKKAGFAATDRWLGAGAGLDGTVAPWIVLHARKTT